MNFLEETKSAIRASGHTPSDIIFIGSEETGHSCTWEEFEKMANFDYDAGYGAAHIPTDLIIVFEDGQKLWRGEYDGSEWWEFSRPFEMPEELKPLTSLQSRGLWPTVEDCCKPTSEKTDP